VRPLGLSLLAALALHVVVVLIARALPPLSQLVPADQRELRLIEIELPSSIPKVELPPVPEPDQPEAARPSESDRPPDPRVARAAPVTGAVPEGSPTGQPSPETNPAPAPTQKGTQFDELPDEHKGGVLGVPGGPGGPALWSVPGVLPTGVAAAAPAPTVAPARRPVDKDIAGIVVRDAMAANDKNLGLDLPAAGTASTVVRGVMQGADVPTGSRGTIVFRIGPNGQVLSSSVASMVGGTADQWNRVAKDAAAQLAGRGLAMTGAYANGATITIDVNVLLTSPSGSKGGFTGTGAAFDVSNIGSHQTRLVRTSFRVAAAH
jgi:hypothetical protein